MYHSDGVKCNGLAMVGMLSPRLDCSTTRPRVNCICSIARSSYCELFSDFKSSPFQSIARARCCHKCQYHHFDIFVEAMDTPDLASIPPEIYNEDRGPMFLIVIWVFASLALATVSIRLWTRFKILHRSGPEDFLMVFAWVSTAIYQLQAWS